MAGRVLWRIAAGLGLVHLVIAFTPLLGWWTVALSSKWGPDDGDVLVVLGGEMSAPDLLGTGTYWRCYYATLVWKGAHFRELIVSGEGAAPEMKAFLVARGIPEGAVIVENESTSTRENALNVAKLLKGLGARVVVLTSDYHAGRALAAFHRVGVAGARALPYPDAGKRLNRIGQRWDVLLLLLDETVKRVYYKVAGWT